MLDAYETERQPITEQVSRHAMQSMLDMIDALGKGPVPRRPGSSSFPSRITSRCSRFGKLVGYDAAMPEMIRRKRP